MKELDVQIQIKNNRLVERRERLGMSQIFLCELLEIRVEDYRQLERLERSPFRRIINRPSTCIAPACAKRINVGKSERLHFCLACRTALPETQRAEIKSRFLEEQPYVVIDAARKLMDYYDCGIEELFPDAVLRIKNARASAKMDTVDVNLWLDNAQQKLLVNPDSAVDREDIETMVSNLMSALTPREEMVIRQRFGIGGTPVKSLKNIGKMEHHNPETIRQVQERALRKLRTAVRRQRLGEDL